MDPRVKPEDDKPGGCCQLTEDVSGIGWSRPDRKASYSPAIRWSFSTHSMATRWLFDGHLLAIRLSFPGLTGESSLIRP